MAILRLESEQIAQFLMMPETAMGLQVVGWHGERTPIAFVLGGTVLLVPDGKETEEISEMMKQPWFQSRSNFPSDERQDGFERWLQSRENAPSFEVNVIPRNFLHMILVPPSPFPPSPIRPPYIYGHLPYSGSTGPNDVFYRCEPWPVSRRVDQTTKTIAHGTYGCPSSELPFFPTGFAAVGRYALPNIAPACYRWELQPKEGSQIHCGASVPLYGQAGGGVEVCFDALTSNRGPIANPVLLPAL